MLRDFVDSFWMDKLGNEKVGMEYADLSRQQLAEVLDATQKQLARVESGAGNSLKPRYMISQFHTPVF